MVLALSPLTVEPTNSMDFAPATVITPVIQLIRTK